MTFDEATAQLNLSPYTPLPDEGLEKLRRAAIIALAEGDADVWMPLCEKLGRSVGSKALRRSRRYNKVAEVIAEVLGARSRT